MSDTVYTHNFYHLGDNLVFLHLLRALAKQRVSSPFVHFCHGHLIEQLREAVADIPNIILEPFESPLWDLNRQQAINVWKNADDQWVNSPLRWDWSAFTLWHHRQVAARMGFESPFTCREHLLFDYPILGGDIREPDCDFLIIDAEPCSGQFAPMAKHGSDYLRPVITMLSDKWGVRTTSVCKEQGMTISEIGALSRRCRHIIGIATGPLWPCVNVHNNHNHEGRRFIALLSNGESLNLPHWEQRESVEQVFDIAKEEGWI